MRPTSWLLVLAALAVCAVAPPARAQWPANGLPICTLTGAQSNPALVPDGSGGVIVVWQDARSGTDIYAQRVNGNGATLWAANGQLMCGATGTQAFPSAVTDGAGGVIAVWQDGRLGPGQEDVRAGRVLANGTLAWGDTVVLCGAPGGQLRPAACSDGAGGVIAAWQDKRFGIDIYAQRMTGAGLRAWTLDGVAVCLAPQGQNGTVIASDDSGGAVVAWGDARDSNPKIYAQRVNVAGTPLWDPDGVTVSSNQFTNTQPSVCGDAHHGCLTGFSSFNDLYAQRFTAERGNWGWTQYSTAVCTAAGVQTTPVIAPDGAGGAFVAWQDPRDGTNVDLYAIHMLTGGVRDPAWPIDGLKVCGAPGTQADPAIIGDGVGGCIIAWDDLRGTSRDVYALRLNANGARAAGWPADGAAVCTAAGEQSVPVLATDGHGGAYVSWSDPRNAGDLDLYVQHLSAGGAAVSVPPAPAVAFAATLASAQPSRGGAIVRLTLPAAGRIEARVVDIGGRVMRRLDQAPVVAGSTRLAWDGSDDRGRRVPAGLYLLDLVFRSANGGVERTSVRVVTTP